YHARALRCQCLRFFRRPLAHFGAGLDRRAVDRLCDDRLCRAAHSDARHEEPGVMAWLRLRRGRRVCPGAFCNRPARGGRRRLRASPTLFAQQTAAPSEILKTETPILKTLKGTRIWKSSC